MCPNKVGEVFDILVKTQTGRVLCIRQHKSGEQLTQIIQPYWIHSILWNTSHHPSIFIRTEMSIVETDWGAFLAPDSDIRPDVIFRVEGASEEGQKHVKNIPAHRMFLAGVSPVFMGMFFGPLKETREIVDVKEISPEAFDNMIKFIYNSREGNMFNLEEINCPQKLFEILAVADKYQINSLATLVMSALENLDIGRGNMIFAATTAKNYKHAFDELSTKVLLKCLKFFLDTRGGLDVCALIEETFDNFPGASLDILRELFDVGKEALQLPGMLKWVAHLLPVLNF